MTDIPPRNTFMKRVAIKLAPRMAPKSLANLRTLSSLADQFEQGPARFVVYERELRDLRREIDELRRDNRRVAELYDVVFERARADAAARGVTPESNPDATVEKVARQLVRDEPNGGAAEG